MANGAPDPLEQALRAVGELLGSLPARSMLIGGMAVIANGHIRTTDDVDATVAGGAVSDQEILDRAAMFGIVPRIPDPLGFAERNQILSSEALREFDEVLEDGRSRVELWHQIARSAYPA